MGTMRMDGEKGFFTRPTRIERRNNSNNPGLVLLLFGFVIIVVGSVEGQNINTTTSSTNESTNTNPTPVAILNGQLVIGNNNTSESPASSSSPPETTMMSGQMVNNSSSNSSFDSSTPLETMPTTTMSSGSSVMNSSETTMSSAGSEVTPSGDTTTGSLATGGSSTTTSSSSAGQSTTTSSGQSSSVGSISTTTMSPQSSNSSSLSSAPGQSPNANLSNSTATNVSSAPGTGGDAGQALYAQCQMKTGIVCFGDKRNCIQAGNCTFLGAISENDSFINVQLLTRTYDPPYQGVNLTVELSRERKGNDSVIRCNRPRFKSFKIRLSWNKGGNTSTTSQPGNETKLSNTLIDKYQLKAECLADQEKNNFTIPPSKTLALKFYIENQNDSTNTLVSQGLSEVSIQDNARSGRNMGSPSNSTGPSPTQSKEDTLYAMCLQNTAKCFGDTAGCTEAHNCSFLGVIKENTNNYHVYVVTQAYPSVDQILTLTLNPASDNSTNSTDGMSDMSGYGNSSEIDCGHPDFQNVTVQSTWPYSKVPLGSLSQVSTGSEILEAIVDKTTIKNSCESYLQMNSNSSSSGNGTMGEIMENENLPLSYQFHLVNGTLVPLGFTNQSDTGNVTTYAYGLNGTAYLVSDNTNSIMTGPDSGDSASASPVQNNSGPKMNLMMSSLILCLSASILVFS